MGCGEGLVMAVSPAWPVAAERIKEREMVGGEEWRAGNGPPGSKAHRSQQSLGRSRQRDTQRRLPPLTPPQKVPMGRVGGRIPSPH